MRISFDTGANFVKRKLVAYPDCSAGDMTCPMENGSFEQALN